MRSIWAGIKRYGAISGAGALGAVLVLGVAPAVSTIGMAPIATADTVARPAANQQYINAVISRALAQRGVPYVYGGGNASGPTAGVPQPQAQSQQPQVQPEQTGGASTSTGLFGTSPATPAITAPPAASPAPATPAGTVGFDSSGLVLYSYAGIGVKLPRSSGQQYAVGRKVDPAQALPGDLIFYGPDGSQSVALFLGNGQMIEATTPAVAVSPVRTTGMAPYLVRIVN